MGIKLREFMYICLIPVLNPQASRAITMLRFLDCVNILAPTGRQVCRNVDTPNSIAPDGIFDHQIEDSFFIESIEPSIHHTTKAPAGRQVCRNVDTPNSKAPEGRQVCRNAETPYSKAPEGRQVCRNAETPYSKAPEGRQVCRNAETPYSKAPAGRHLCRNAETPYSKAPAGRQVDNCVRHLPRENRVTRPKTLNSIPMQGSNEYR